MTLRLIYWAGRGLMEPARMMCALSDTPVSDERLSAPPADADALLAANLGRMPLLVTKDGVAIGQSAAIYHYVAEVRAAPRRWPTGSRHVAGRSRHVCRIMTTHRAVAANTTRLARGALPSHPRARRRKASSARTRPRRRASSPSAST